MVRTLHGRETELLYSVAETPGRDLMGVRRDARFSVRRGMMLEPQLAHNRDEFHRFERLKGHVLWVGPVAVAIALIIIIVLGRLLDLRSELLDRMILPVVMAILGLGFLFMGYCEARMTLIFRRDLREQRELDGEQRDDEA